MLIKHGVFSLVFLLCSGTVFSQEFRKDTVLELKGVEISGTGKSVFLTGLTVETIDSVQLSQFQYWDLSTVLSSMTPVYLKSSGPGSLASLSIRGTSAGQSTVLWNGIDIKASGAGMTDLSLIPTFLFDKIEIQHGGASSLYGSGIIGGSVSLLTPPKFQHNKTLYFGSEVASFHGNSSHVKLQWSDLHWSTQTSAYINNTQNDFNYKIGSRTFSNEHAAIHQYGLLHQSDILLKSNQLITLACWYESSRRETPAPITGNNQNANLENEMLRLTTTWKKIFSRGYWSVRAAGLHDFLHYTEIPGDTLVLVDSRITNQTLWMESEYFRRIGENISFNMGVKAENATIDINRYGGKCEQNQMAVYTSVMKHWPRRNKKLSLNIRQDFVRGYSILPSPSLGFESDINKLISMSVNLSRNFRLPAMNDRFWQPGGNENLKPEVSLNAEMGLKAEKSWPGGFAGKLRLTGFVNDVENWILWVPGSSSGWMAQNAQAVRIKGWEGNAEFTYAFGKYQLRSAASITEVSTINQKRTSDKDESYHKQLIYTPETRWNAYIGVARGRFMLKYLHAYTGITYTTRDNLSSLPDYHVGNVLVSAGLPKFLYAEWNIRFEVLNVWDKNYEVIEYYPMPGRSFRFGIDMKFK